MLVSTSNQSLLKGAFSCYNVWLHIQNPHPRLSYRRVACPIEEACSLYLQICIACKRIYL
ncbi:hypothetical protein QUC31_016234 [Theobroma cacao]